MIGYCVLTFSSKFNICSQDFAPLHEASCQEMFNGYEHTSLFWAFENFRCKSFIVQVVAEFKTYQRIFFNHMFESFGGTLGVVEWDLK